MSGTVTTSHSPLVTAGRVSSLPVVPRSLRSRSLLPCMRWESVASHRVNCDEELKAWHLDLPFIPISCLSLASDGGSEAWATDRHEASMRWEWSSVVASLVPGLLRALHLQSASHRRAGERNEEPQEWIIKGRWSHHNVFHSFPLSFFVGMRPPSHYDSFLIWDYIILHHSLTFPSLSINPDKKNDFL